MDGVLADYYKRYNKLYGKLPSDPIASKKHFFDNWDNFVLGNNFTKLDLMPGALTLLKACKMFNVPIEILSSTGTAKYHTEVAAQKTKWLHDHGINFKTNFVDGGEKKAKYAEPWNILIDDTPEVVKAYRKAGGTAILHTDVDTTIKKLLALFLEWHGGQ